MSRIRRHIRFCGCNGSLPPVGASAKTEEMRILLFCLLCLLSALLSEAGDWSQATGPNFDFSSSEAAPVEAFSASLDQNVAWRTTLPETGQSTPVVSGGRVFLTTMKPVETDSEIGSDIVAYCLAADTGEILWKKDIPGGYTTKLSAPFSDASAPPAMSDGKNVWFLNPTGRLVCFDFDGSEVWSKEVRSVSRCQPILLEGKIIVHRQVYLPDEEGHFDHSHLDVPKEEWTQLQAIDSATGEQIWVSECGVNMGCAPLLQHLNDGSPVIVVGRGGGHSPPEKPEGVSMISAETGETLWTLALPGYMSTQTFPIVDDMALIFNGNEHLWVNATDGSILKAVNLVKEVPVCRWENGKRVIQTENLPDNKPRAITQGSNLCVGNYHFFRAYTKNYLGRIDLKSGKVEYLELPLQVLRERGKEEQTLWNAEQRPADLVPLGNKKLKNNISYVSLRLNSMRNSRGFKVSGDGRDIGNGWGHTASPYATAIGNRLFVPILSGMVFVVDTEAEKWDESAGVSVSDLGELGDAYTRASISTDGTRLYGRTIREVLAFE